MSEKQALEFSVGERRDGLAIVRLDGSSCDAVTLARALARAEMPLVGDLERGGLGIAGGARLIVTDGRGSSSIDWPDEPAWMSADRETAMLSLQVSDETARAIRKGHPWILPDDASDSASRFRSGTLVRVVSRGGGDLGWARVEGTAFKNIANT